MDSGWRKDVACKEDVSLRMDNGQGEDVSLKMDSGWGECGLGEIMKRRDKTFIEEKMGQGKDMSSVRRQGQG